MNIKYCKKCIMPETKPDLHIDENGVCNACRYFDQRVDVDWDQRELEFKSILDRYRSKDGNKHDCIIPVSGGKDSTYMTLKMLEYGMNPLCVTSTTCKLSDIGRRNIENIKKLGVDYIEVSTNPVVRSRINKLTLKQVGDISWAEHLTIFTIPIRISVQMNIPLIIWGENSQNENGGPAADAENNTLSRNWLEEFGGLLGLRVSDLVGQEGIRKQDLILYNYPSNEELEKVGVTGLFLGYYIPWDGHNNALIAQAYGFESYPKQVEGSIINYENLDNLQMRIHDYFKYLKFGFDRSTDWACWHIRRGRLTRGEGVELAKQNGGRFPWTYLGKPIEEIMDDIDMTMEEFNRICDQFTNKKLFKSDKRGNLIKNKDGDLIKINYDNVE
ncbi:MAG: N-acetyl sugar amidotransferase [Desulfobacterales bacterium]|nr:N-acetyl sugar amidotransferase [Desulfobacterales bacterium]